MRVFLDGRPTSVLSSSLLLRLTLASFTSSFLTLLLPSPFAAAALEDDGFSSSDSCFWTLTLPSKPAALSTQMFLSCSACSLLFALAFGFLSSSSDAEAAASSDSLLALVSFALALQVRHVLPWRIKRM